MDYLVSLSFFTAPIFSYGIQSIYKTPSRLRGYYLRPNLKWLFSSKNGVKQYNAALAITGAVRRTSREKLYQALGLESLRKRRWYRKVCYFFKIFKGQSPKYLFKILPSVSKAHNTKTYNNNPLLSGKHNYFKNFFFLNNCHRIEQLKRENKKFWDFFCF